jgi:leucyl/phenylalanyl-tRNA--protein transferase
VPIEPPPTVWEIPDIDRVDLDDVVAVGADLAPGTIIAAYRKGIFPMPVEDQLAWWSPRSRGIIPLDNLHITKSLKQSMHRYSTTIDSAFSEVISSCADSSRPGAWITEEIQAAYVELHDLGWAHSIETWRDDTLVGGLYGIAIGGFFAGESMFHNETDASKVALVRLVEELNDGGAQLLDVQWLTPHLHSLGAKEVSRSEYLELLEEALELPLPKVFLNN